MPLIDRSTQTDPSLLEKMLEQMLAARGRGGGEEEEGGATQGGNNDDDDDEDCKSVVPGPAVHQRDSSSREESGVRLGGNRLREEEDDSWNGCAAAAAAAAAEDDVGNDDDDGYCAGDDGWQSQMQYLFSMQHSSSTSFSSSNPSSSSSNFSSLSSPPSSSSASPICSLSCHAIDAALFASSALPSSLPSSFHPPEPLPGANHRAAFIWSLHRPSIPNLRLTCSFGIRALAWGASASHASNFSDCVFGGTTSGQVAAWDWRAGSGPCQQSSAASTRFGGHFEAITAIATGGGSDLVVTTSLDGRCCTWSCRMLRSPLLCADLMPPPHRPLHSSPSQPPPPQSPSSYHPTLSFSAPPSLPPLSTSSFISELTQWPVAPTALCLLPNDSSRFFLGTEGGDILEGNLSSFSSSTPPNLTLRFGGLEREVKPPAAASSFSADQASSWKDRLLPPHHLLVSSLSCYSPTNSSLSTASFLSSSKWPQQIRSLDASLLLSSSWDSSVSLWHSSRPQQPLLRIPLPSVAHAACLSPLHASQLAASHGSGNISLFDLSSPNPRRPSLSLHLPLNSNSKASPIALLQWTADGRCLLGGDLAGRVHVWRLKS